MKSVYPVFFTQTESIILVEVPDLNIHTEGNDLADAIDMARDAIGLMGITLVDDGKSIPAPSDVNMVDPEKGTFASDGRSYVALIDVDFEEYRRKHDTRAVRRNVTLPNWLNQEAEKAHINVSKVLQEALMTKMNITRE